MRKLAIGLFVLTSVACLLLGVTPRAGGGSAAMGAPAAATDTAASTWNILLIVFQETDTDYVGEDAQWHHLTSSLSNPEIDAMVTSFTGPVAEAVHDWSAGAVQWDVDVRYAPRPVTSLSVADADHRQWLDPDSIQDVIDLYSPDDGYDQIMVYWKDSDGSSTIPSWGWGLALPYSPSRGWGYLTVAAIPANYWNPIVADTWSQVWIHEWLHCACSYYAARGYPMPANDADGGGSHGYVEDQGGLPGWGSFYSDLMQGTVQEDGLLLGITREAWLSGSPRFPTPVVTGLAPSFGTTAGGTSVTITGTNFDSGATAVSFGGTAATNIHVVGDTSITCTSPAHVAGTADVTVTTPGGTAATSSADQFTYLAPNVRSLQSGWNLVAGGSGSSTGGLSLFGWNGTGYVSLSAGSMQGGQGYWCKAGNGDSATLTATVSPVSISLVVGWNLIGNSTSGSVALPSGLTAFVFAGNSYVSTTILAPGEGAWLRSASAQVIELR